MIVGIGCDVVQQERVSQVLERHGDRLAQKLLTESEMRLFEKRRQLSKACFGLFGDSMGCQRGHLQGSRHRHFRRCELSVDVDYA